MVFSSPISFLVLYIFIGVSFCFPINSLETKNHQSLNQTFRSPQQLYKLKKVIAARLQQINKPAIKTIQSPDGDIIDCVLTHKQPAFDHPLLKGQKPMDPPESLRRQTQIENTSDHFQIWSLSGESCPEGSIPIRRITEEDMLRAYSINSFGRKYVDPLHEYVVVSETNDKFYGGGGIFNVWTPYIENPREYSFAQMWLEAGTPGKDLNTIEIGWQVYPRLYGDYRTRVFIYWTGDNHNSTGCYNLVCSGFVQTNKNFAIGGAINKISTYKGIQYSMTLKVLKHYDTGNWWLIAGPRSGTVIGYWPSKLFTHLKDAANEVNFGGEILNLKKTGSHTATAMGNGNFPEEGFGKAAYIRNLQVRDAGMNPKPFNNPRFGQTNYACYSISQGNTNPEWGYHIYFGGHGRSKKCR